MTIFDFIVKKKNKICNVIENKKLVLKKLIYVIIDRLLNKIKTK